MGCCNGRTGGAELTPAQELPEEEIVIHQQENDNPFSDKSAQTLTNEFLLQGKSGRLTFTQLEIACRNIGIQVDLLTSSESQFASFSNELLDDNGNFITKKLYLSSLLIGQGSLTEKIKLLSKYFELGGENGSITENNAQKLIEDLIEVAVVISPHLAEGEGKLTEDEIKRFSQELNKNKSGLVKKLAAKIMGSEEHIDTKQFIDKFFKNEDLQQLLTTTGIRSMLRDENARVISVRDEVKSSFDFSKAKKSLQEPYTTKGNPELEEEKIIENTTLDTNRTNNKSSEISLSARSAHFNFESEIVEEQTAGKHEKKSLIENKDSVQPSKLETQRKEENSSLKRDKEAIESKREEEDYKQTSTTQSLEKTDKSKIVIEKHHQKDQEKSEREKEFKIINDTYRNLGERSPRTESEITEKSLTDIKIVDLKLSPILDNYEEEEEEESSNDIKIDYNPKIAAKDNRKTHNVSLEIKAPLLIESQTSDEALNSSDIAKEGRKADTENIEKEKKLSNKDFEKQNISGLSSEGNFKASDEIIIRTGIINEERKVDSEIIEKENSTFIQDFGGQNISAIDSESNLQNNYLKGIEEVQKISVQSSSEAQSAHGFGSKIESKKDDAVIVEEIKEGDKESIKEAQHFANSDLKTELKVHEIKTFDLESNGAQIQNSMDFSIEPKEGDIKHINEDKRLNTEIIENRSIPKQDYLKNVAGEEILAAQSSKDSQNYFTSGSDTGRNVKNEEKMNNESISGTQNISIIASEQNDIKNQQAEDVILRPSNNEAQLISPHSLEVKQSHIAGIEKKDSEDISDPENISQTTIDLRQNIIKNSEEEKNIISGHIKNTNEENVLSDKHNLSTDLELSIKKSLEEEKKDVNEDIAITENNSALKIDDDSQISEEKIIDNKLIVRVKNDSEFNKGLETIRDEIRNIEEEKKADIDEILELQNASSSVADSRRCGIQDIENLEKGSLNLTREEDTKDIDETKKVFGLSSSVDSVKSDFKNIEEGKKDEMEEIHSEVKSTSELSLGIDSDIDIKNIEEEKKDLAKEILGVHNDPAFNASPDPKSKDIRNTEKENQYVGKDSKVRDSSTLRSEIDSKIDYIDIIEEKNKYSIVEGKTNPIEIRESETIEEGKMSVIEEGDTQAIEEVKIDASEEVKTETIQKVENDTSGVKAGFIEKIKTGVYEEGETGDAGEGEKDAIEKLKANAIEEVKIDTIHEAKSDTIERAKTDFIEKVKTNVMEKGENDIIELKTDAIEKLKVSDIEEIKTEVIEEVKIDDTQEVKTGDIDEMEIGAAEEIKKGDIDELKIDATEEVKTGDIDGVKIGAAEVLEEVKIDATEEVKTGDIDKIEIGATKEIKKGDIDEVKIDATEEVKKGDIDEVKIGSNIEVIKSDIDEVKIGANDEVKKSDFDELKTDAIEEGKTRAIEEGKAIAIEEGKTNVIEEIKTEAIEEGKNDTNEEGKTGNNEEGKTKTIEVKKSDIEEAELDSTKEVKKSDNEEAELDFTKEVKEGDIEEGKTNAIEEGKTYTNEEGKTNATEEGKIDINEEGKTNMNEEGKTNAAEEVKIRIIEGENANANEDVNYGVIEEANPNANEDVKMGVTEDSSQILISSGIRQSESESDNKNIKEKEKSEQNPEIHQRDIKNTEEHAKMSLESQNIPKLFPQIEGTDIEGEIIAKEVAETQYALGSKSNNSNLEEKTNIEEISSLRIDENNQETIKQADSKNIEEINIRDKSLDHKTSELDASIESRIANVANLEIEEDNEQAKLTQSIESKHESIKSFEEEGKISIDYRRKEDMEQNLYKKDLEENKVEALGREGQETAVEIQVEPVAISLNPEFQNSKEGTIIGSSAPFLENNPETEAIQKENESSNIINTEKESSNTSYNGISLQLDRNTNSSAVEKDKVPQSEIILKIESEIPVQSTNDESKEYEAKNFKTGSSSAIIKTTDKNTTKPYENSETANKIAPSTIVHEPETKVIQENYLSAEKAFAKDVSVSMMLENTSSIIESPKIVNNFESDMTNQAKLESSPSRGSIGMEEDKERVSLFPYQYLSLTKSEENISEHHQSSMSEAPKNVQEVAKLADSGKPQKEKKPVVIQMNLGPGKVEKFEVRPGDDPVQMAYDFANSHQFNQRERLKLVKTMTELKAKLNY
ncbi:unnamed protein product [Blepharisma stoltei]|uniref:Uncharacterized protein n=1 Tax=Blepharisma stoltei TaxID=1481888 RepID=A0AAU9JQA7_9CILI|nr:unnamed protein product [Blepharisma stoltei]